MTLLHTKPEVAAQERMVDDGDGKIEVSLMIPNPEPAGSTGPPGCPAVEQGTGGDPGSALLSPSSPVPRGVHQEVSWSAVSP